MPNLEYDFNNDDYQLITDGNNTAQLTNNDYIRITVYENLRNELSDKINGINTRLKPKIAQFNTRYAKDLNIKQKPLSFDNLQAEANESRIASDQATKSEFTQEYQRTQQAVANSLRKKLKDLGLVDVDLVTKNVITPDEVLDIDGKTISPTDKKSSSELFRKFGLPEGFEMDVTEGKRIITLDSNFTSSQISWIRAIVIF